MSEEMMSAKKHFSNIGKLFLLETILFNVLQIGVVNLFHLIMPKQMENSDFALIIQMLPVYLIAMPLIIWLLSRLPGDKPEKKKMTAGQFILAMFMSYTVVYLSNIIGMVLTGVIGAIKGSGVSNVAVDLVTQISPITRMIVMVICAPIFEELIFRKMLVDKTIRYGEGIAVLLSGLMFGLFHGNLNQFAYAFTLGAFLAFIYVKTGNIRYTIGLHMFINFMSGVLGGWLLDLVDYNGLMEITTGGDSMAIMEFVASHAVGLAVFGCYVILLVGMVITGLVLFIANRKKFKLQKGEVVLEKGKRFSTIVLNLGMGLYCLAWLGMIIFQLFA